MQNLLQEDKLRLDLHVKLTRCVEEGKQDLSKRDLGNGCLEIRVANAANHRFKFLQVCLGGYPSTFDMKP